MQASVHCVTFSALNLLRGLSKTVNSVSSGRSCNLRTLSLVPQAARRGDKGVVECRPVIPREKFVMRKEWISRIRNQGVEPDLPPSRLVMLLYAVPAPEARREALRTTVFSVQPFSISS